VIVEDDMLGIVGSLRYADHDLIDMRKLPELGLDKYRSVKITPNSQAIIV
jgi:hypothetical protein